MADYIQKDNPLRFPEAGTDWFEEVGVGTGIPVTANDLIGSTLTYSYNGNTIVYDYDNTVDTWTGRVAAAASPVPPTVVYWAENGSTLHPINLTKSVAVGKNNSSADIFLNSNGEVKCKKVTSVTYNLDSLPSLPSLPNLP